ncbi:MAG: response regulator [Patescibacteria group bacterium]|nr:response regulator [Patescibacteria group bacterium]
MTQTILLIEDEPQIVEIYRKAFQRHSPFNLLTARTKEEGWRLAMEKRPQIILLDLIIPEREGEMVAYDRRVGFDLLRELRHLPETRELPVVVFSNIDTHEDRTTSEELGVTDYLLKAEFSPAALVQKIQGYL